MQAFPHARIGKNPDADFGPNPIVNRPKSQPSHRITPSQNRIPILRAVATVLILVQVALALCSCATRKEINGEKIIGTRWVDGKVVYVTAPANAEQQEKIRQEANELRKLNDETKFEPIKK